MGFFHKSLGDAKKKLDINDFQGAFEIMRDHYKGEAILSGELKDLNVHLTSFFAALDQYLTNHFDGIETVGETMRQARIKSGKKYLYLNLESAEKEIQQVEKLIHTLSTKIKKEK
ncbi:hypothetical protein HZB01_04080 [Candidatus Woesearchaeota archaeon]|nr:hypothetical protein [Candidatus Woesearchaeota archaeon]